MKLTDNKSRRKNISQILITFFGIFFLSCNSGDSSSTGPPLIKPLGTSNQGGTGILVYRSSKMAGIYNFNKLTNTEINPGELPTLGVGIGASPAGQLVTAQKGDREGEDFFIVIFDRNGNLIRRVGMKGLLSKISSAITMAGDGKRIAFSVEEKMSEFDNRRIKRSVILNIESETIVAQLDNFESPVWIHKSGELVARQIGTGTLHLFDSNFMDKGAIGSFTVSSRIASYDISPDGRFIIWEDGNKIYAVDRNTDEQWIAVEDRSNAVYAPLFAPNGRLLVLHGKKAEAYVPQVVPFVQGNTVNLEPDIHAITNNNVTATFGRMGWFE